MQKIIAHELAGIFSGMTCPPRAGPGSESVLWQNLRPRGGQDEAKSFYVEQIARMLRGVEVQLSQGKRNVRAVGSPGISGFFRVFF
jgi:hypothetical protein